MMLKYSKKSLLANSKLIVLSTRLLSSTNIASYEMSFNNNVLRTFADTIKTDNKNRNNTNSRNNKKPMPTLNSQYFDKSAATKSPSPKFPYQKFNKHTRNKQNHPLRKKDHIQMWKSGSERAKIAATKTYNEIMKYNGSGTIKTIDLETGKLVVSKLKSLVEGIDLDKDGIQLANLEKTADGSIIPIVKIVESKVALKKYSDELAITKEKELADMGVNVKKFSKISDQEKAVTNIKHIRLAWKIKEDDLKRQKAHEIQSALKRGHKVFIYIDDKFNSSNNWMSNFESSLDQTNTKLQKNEISHREKIVDIIKNVVEELSHTPIVDGSIRAKMLIKLTPSKEAMSKNNDSKENEVKNLKNQRKLERQKKLEERIQRKIDRKINES